MTPGQPADDDDGVGPVDDVAPTAADAAMEDRFSRRLAAAGRPAVVALVAGVTTLAASLACLLALLAQPRDDTVVSTTRASFEASGVAISDATDSGLRDDDVVVAIDGVPVDEIARRPFDAALDVRDGTTITYDVRRDGETVSVAVPVEQPDFTDIVGANWSGAVLVPVLALMGAYLLWRRPDLPAARTLFVVGSLAVLSWVLTTRGPTPLDLAAGRPWVLAGGVALYACEVGVLYFVLVLTDTATVRRRFLAVVAVAALAFVVDAAIGFATASTATERLGTVFFPRLEPLVVLATLVAAIVQYRRATSELTRRQLRLVAWQLVVSGAVFIAVFALPEAVGGGTLLPASLSGATFWPFPPVLAVAALRFDLFELRLLLHRSVLYLTLTATVAALYVVVVALLSLAIGDHGAGVSAVAAATVAVAFHPLRVRLQRAIDRLVYGTAAEPTEVLSALGRQLEDRGQPGLVLDRVAETVARSLSRPYVAIEAGDDEPTILAAHGTPAERRIDVPLVHQGERVGSLIVGLPDDTSEIGPAEQRLLTGIAAHIGTAVAAARLTVDLQRSRERLVTALEDERRRLGRDLHDGLGPRLAAASMKLEAAGRLSRRDLDAGIRLHDEVRAELNDVIGEVRRIVYALRPPALDQLGLVGALREQANRLAVPVDGSSTELSVTVDGELAELPAAVEVAAFRIASEAMTNAVRHAGARRCDVLLRVADTLQVSVVDDGAGIDDDSRRGIGLASMRERADELGGSLSVRRSDGRGTIVQASLPLASA